MPSANLHFNFCYNKQNNKSIIKEAMKLIFRDSAFRHGLTQEQLCYAFGNVIKSKRIYSKEFDYENIWAIGFLPNGNDCELIFFYQDLDTAIIFHAMSPARKSFVDEMER